MHLLKESITSITYPLDQGSTHELLLEKLKEINLEVESENEQHGAIVVSCLTGMFNMLFWRCWIDKLLFKVIPLENNNTRVDIFGLPNLFRIKVKKEETLVDVDELLSQLK
jgi:hypothetical protein